MMVVRLNSRSIVSEMTDRSATKTDDINCPYCLFSAMLWFRVIGHGHKCF